MRLSLAALTVVSLGLLGGGGRADDGREFAPKNGMFTVTLPDGEKTTEKTRVLVLGKRRVPVEASATQKDGAVYSGGSIGIPAVAMRDIPADKRFDVIRDALAKAMGGKVAEERDIQQEAVPGKEYLIALPKGRVARVQVYTVAGWVIEGVVEGTKEQVTSKAAEDFLATLKLTDKAKEVFARVKR